jgi:hypothetical protein
MQHQPGPGPEHDGAQDVPLAEVATASTRLAPASVRAPEQEDEDDDYIGDVDSDDEDYIIRVRMFVFASFFVALASLGNYDPCIPLTVLLGRGMGLSPKSDLVAFSPGECAVSCYALPLLSDIAITSPRYFPLA